MENERVLFVGLTVASQASQAPELLLGRPRIVLLERERPALPVDTCRCQEGGHQGTKAPRHEGTKAATQGAPGHRPRPNSIHRSHLTVLLLIHRRYLSMKMKTEAV